MEILPNLSDNIGELVYDVATQGIYDETQLLAVIHRDGKSYQVHLKVIPEISDDFIDWEDNVPHFNMVDGYLTPVHP